MRGLDHPLGASNARAGATLTGMVTPEMASLLDLGGAGGTTASTDRTNILPLHTIFSSFLNDYIGSGTESIESKESTTQSVTESGRNNAAHRDEFSHEYVILKYSPELLRAMKTYGMENCGTMHPGGNVSRSASRAPVPMPFVSTNDMITAMGWMVKRRSAERLEWNLSMVVNLRSRGGVEGFGRLDDPTIGVGVFGNALTSVVAELPRSNAAEGITMAEVCDAASAIRESLARHMPHIEDRRILSLLGEATQTPDQGRCFSTTSWRQFSIWDISFDDDDFVGEGQHRAVGLLDGFYGRPSYPLPVGDTYSSVVVPSRCGGCTYKLLAPSRRVQSILTLHRDISEQFLEWANCRVSLRWCTT
jgi:hypothetical protein